jgi:4-hydroxyacetophenone monooxygenase
VSIARAIEPITEADDAIRKALNDAFIPALIPALVQLTGDLSLLRDDLRPPGVAPGVEQGGMTPEQQAAARALAFDTLTAFRDGRIDRVTRPIEEELRAITGWMTGSPAADDYIPLLLEELAPPGEDPREPSWRAPKDAAFRVAIIGAGMSGILAGIRLKQAGVPFVIIEKNADVGGTWFENTYPGARVDVSNAFYSYSFAQKTDWPKHFSPQEVLLDYFRDCANEYGLRDHIRFNTEVVSADFNEDSRAWSLQLRTPGGGSEAFEAQALISAVGQLNRPKMPDIAGVDRFAGQSFHSARWDHSVDLKGKRVIVIGNGASAAQFIPIIVKDAADLTIFQRTPNWFVPVPHYHDAVPDGLQWLFTHVPNYSHWYRFWLFWNSTDGLLPAAIVDENWPHPERSVSAANDELRALLTMYLQMQYLDRPDLFAKILPSYPPTSKRIVLDNGVWAETLKREHVHLISDGIKEITAAGVVTTDGVEHAADVIIYGTGFQASHFLTPMKVTGRNGIDLNAQWAGDARAYMGITVPNFPNFFMLYGPNTNIVVNGSIIYFSECEVQYVMGCLRLLLQEGHKAMDCKMDVHDAYNVRIDRANLQRTWGASKVNSWYKNEHGHVAQNWPFNLIEYWQQTREPNPADYEFL